MNVVLVFGLFNSIVLVGVFLMLLRYYVYMMVEFVVLVLGDLWLNIWIVIGYVFGGVGEVCDFVGFIGGVCGFVMWGDVVLRVLLWVLFV